MLCKHFTETESPWMYGDSVSEYAHYAAIFSILIAEYGWRWPTLRW